MMPSLPSLASRRESWPPTQLRLLPRTRSNTTGLHKKNDEPRPLLESIDEDPLTYFLTPSGSSSGNDDDQDMDFDAGIEVASPSPHARHARQLSRCVSPSSLERLCRAVTASSSSPLSFDSDGLTSDSESEDGDDSIHFSPSPSPSPKPTNARSPLGSDDSKGLGLLHPALSSSSSFPVQWSWPYSPSSISNSSSNYAAGHLSHGYLASPSRLGGRQGWIWREPSPEVWSIEEETEEEVRRSEMKVGQSNKTKPIKRVRFVLPDEE